MSFRGSKEMNRTKILLAVTLICVFLAVTSCTRSNAGKDSPVVELLKPADLRCEYLVNPLGIDEVKPRLSWKLESNQRGQKQTAYRIVVSSSREKLDKNVGDLWDTDKVKSDQSIHVVYKGKPMESRMRYYWKVRVWDKDSKVSNWSSPGMWSMGLLMDSDWQGAKWIGIEKGLLEEGKGVRGIEIEKNDDKRTRLPARYLRRDFKVTNKVVRATAYVCGLGFFDLHINGRKVGDHVMDPGLTSYKKRAFYVTFDASDYIKSGANCVGVILANGRYFTPRETKRYSTVPNPNQGRISFPKLKMKMCIEYADGKIEEIVSDLDWKVTTEGPIRFNNEFDGEEYDGRMEMAGWDRAGFDDSKWKKVEPVDPPGGVLQSQMIQPMRITEVIKPVKITNPKPGMYLVDMGQAFYGNVRVKVSGPAGTRIQLRSAYNVNPDGTLRSRDNRSALSTDVFILRGKGKETWNPKFRGQAYRFVEVTGFPGAVKPENFQGLVIHTDFETHGEFECSNPLINRIFSNVRWTQRAQTRSLPIDPDRDERQGWMGTMAKDMEGYAYNFNMAPVASKWMDDLSLDQLGDGHLPDSSPAYWWLYRKSVVWPSNILLTPEVQYDFYADRRVIERNYDAMKKWMAFVSQHLKPDFTTDQNRYGDWVDASTMEENCKDSKKPKWIIDHGETTRPLLTTAYYYNNCKSMARFASLLGRQADSKHYEELAVKIKKGFNDRFFDPEANHYGSGTQTSYVLSLAFGMVDDDKRDAVAANLVRDIMVTHKEHLSVGTVGMMWLMQTLTDIGYPEVAYAIAAQTTKPSWGYMVSKGATTVWERWDSDTAGPGMNSEGLLILAGNVEAWFYQTLAGINHDPQNPGFKHIILRPWAIGDLTYAKASYKSMYGKIVSDWVITDGTFKWKVTIPPNTTATVYVPGKSATEGGLPAAEAEGVTFLRVENNKAVYKVESGKYEFKSVVK